MTRLLAGLSFATWPRTLGRLLGGDNAALSGSRLFVRAFGARDALLGFGLLTSHDDARAAWLASCVAADAADATPFLAEWQQLPPRRRALALLASLAPALVGGVLLARRTSEG